MSKKRFILLDHGQKIKAGDQYYNVTTHSWELTLRAGQIFDEDSTAPIRREFEVTATGKIKDVDLSKVKKKKFDLSKIRKVKYMLIRRTNKILDVKFDPNQMSLSKENSYIQYPDGNGIWISTNELEACIIEYIEGFGGSIQ